MSLHRSPSSLRGEEGFPAEAVRSSVHRPSRHSPDLMGRNTNDVPPHFPNQEPPQAGTDAGRHPFLDSARGKLSKPEATLLADGASVETTRLAAAPRRAGSPEDVRRTQNTNKTMLGSPQEEQREGGVVGGREVVGQEPSLEEVCEGERAGSVPPGNLSSSGGEVEDFRRDSSDHMVSTIPEAVLRDPSGSQYQSPGSALEQKEGEMQEEFQLREREQEQRDQEAELQMMQTDEGAAAGNSTSGSFVAGANASLPSAGAHNKEQHQEYKNTTGETTTNEGYRNSSKGLKGFRGQRQSGAVGEELNGSTMSGNQQPQGRTTSAGGLHRGEHEAERQQTPRCRDAAVDTSYLPPVGERDLGKLSPLNLTKEAKAMRGEISPDKKEGSKTGKVQRTPMVNLTKVVTPQRDWSSIGLNSQELDIIKPKRLRRAGDHAGRRGFVIGSGTIGLEERQNPNGQPNQPISLIDWNRKHFLEERERRIAAREEAYRTWREEALAQSTYAQFNQNRKAELMARMSEDDLLKFEESRTKAIAKERKRREKLEVRKRRQYEEDLLKKHHQWKQGEGVYLPDAYHHSAFETLNAHPQPGFPTSEQAVTVQDHHKAQVVRQQQLYAIRNNLEEERREEGAKQKLGIAEQLVESRAEIKAYQKAMTSGAHRRHRRQDRGGYSLSSTMSASSMERGSISSWRGCRLGRGRQPEMLNSHSKSGFGLQGTYCAPQQTAVEPTTTATATPQRVRQPLYPSPPAGARLTGTRPPSSQPVAEVLPDDVVSTARRHRTSRPTSGAHINTVGAPWGAQRGQQASTHLIQEMQMWNSSFQTPNKRPPSGSDPRHRQEWLKQLEEERVQFNQKTAQMQRESSMKAAESREAWMDGNAHQAESEREEKLQHLHRKVEAYDKEQKIIEGKHEAFRHQQQVIQEVRDHQEQERHEQAQAKRENEAALAEVKSKAEQEYLEQRQSSVRRVRGE